MDRDRNVRPVCDSSHSEPKVDRPSSERKISAHPHPSDASGSTAPDLYDVFYGQRDRAVGVCIEPFDSGGWSWARILHMLAATGIRADVPAPGNPLEHGAGDGRKAAIYFRFSLKNCREHDAGGMAGKAAGKRSGKEAARPKACGTWIAKICRSPDRGIRIYAFGKRQIGMYLLLESEFVFVNFEEPRVLLFIDYLAVMGLFIWIGHYAAN